MIDPPWDQNCPVCQGVLSPNQPNFRERSDSSYWNCDWCGKFGLTRSALAAVPKLGSRLENWAAVSHLVRRAQTSEEWPRFNSDTLAKAIETATLPPIQTQADSFILWMYGLDEPSAVYGISHSEVGAIIGTKSDQSFQAIVEGLKEEGLLRPLDSSVSLSFAGWKRAEELRRGTASGFKAFIAMKFEDTELDSIVDNCLRGAVEETGFHLEKLSDSPKAGLIDDRMRVDIRSARFLIADLTHGNRGAYWEAGYGEGLGKPVIYTCKREIFEDKNHKCHPHFDTNHHLIVKWDPEDPGATAQSLKATIRATIPEAKQSDD